MLASNNIPGDGSPFHGGGEEGPDGAATVASQSVSMLGSEAGPGGRVCITGMGGTGTSPTKASAKGAQSSTCQGKERRQEKERRNGLI